MKTERVKVAGNYIHNETGKTEDKIMGELTRIWDIIQRAMWGPLRVLRRRVTWFDFFFKITLDYIGLDWIEWIKTQSRQISWETQYCPARMMEALTRRVAKRIQSK